MWCLVSIEIPTEHVNHWAIKNIVAHYKVAPRTNRQLIVKYNGYLFAESQ